MPEVRRVALAWIEKKGKYLFAESFDTVKNEVFYRPLGGGIDDGEDGQQAILREIKEEIGYAIKVIKKLGELENIYTFNGRPGHEIDVIYSAEFIDQAPYDMDEIPKHDGYSKKAVWLSVNEMTDKIIYPSGIEKFVKP